MVIGYCYHGYWLLLPWLLFSVTDGNCSVFRDLSLITKAVYREVGLKMVTLK